MHDVPRGSVLDTILFFIHINDFRKNIQYTIKIFASDTKLYREVGSGENNPTIKSNLIEMGALSKKERQRERERERERERHRRVIVTPGLKCLTHIKKYREGI